MSNHRRARRTDLREGSLDIDKLFVNAQLDTDGKILLPSEVNPQEWNFASILFLALTVESGFPGQQGVTTLTNFYSFNLGHTPAQDDNGELLLRIYINGLKLEAGQIEASGTTIYIGLNYSLDNTDSIEIWYVEN
jgi:hypothetical protein